MKKYTAQHHKKQFVLITKDDEEVERIVDISKFFTSKHYIILDSVSYDIRNVGFLRNDLELFNSKGVIYFTDLGKERIIRSGDEVKIYQFKLGRTNRLFEKGKLLIEVREERRRFKDSIFHIEVEDSVDDLLTLVFLHYSTQEFNYIGGEGS